MSTTSCLDTVPQRAIATTLILSPITGEWHPFPEPAQRDVSDWATPIYDQIAAEMGWVK